MIDIQYDRKEKCYRWVHEESGEVLTAPSKMKHELFKAAIGLLDPDLYQAAHNLIEKHPQLERVTWRAVELVTSEAVEVFTEPRGNVQAMVNSSDGYGRYAVSTTDGYYSCQCEHWQSFSAPMTEQGNRYCKHILGMYLWRVTREERF